MDTAVCHPDDIAYHHMSSGWLCWNWYLIPLSYENVILSSGWHYASILKSSGWDRKFRFSSTRDGPSALQYVYVPSTGNVTRIKVFAWKQICHILTKMIDDLIMLLGVMTMNALVLFNQFTLLFNQFTHGDQKKMCHFADDIVKSIFMNEILTDWFNHIYQQRLHKLPLGFGTHK